MTVCYSDTSPSTTWFTLFLTKTLTMNLASYGPDKFVVGTARVGCFVPPWFPYKYTHIFNAMKVAHESHILIFYHTLTLINIYRKYHTRACNCLWPFLSEYQHIENLLSKARYTYFFHSTYHIVAHHPHIWNHLEAHLHMFALVESQLPQREWSKL